MVQLELIWLEEVALPVDNLFLGLTFMQLAVVAWLSLCRRGRVALASLQVLEIDSPFA
jgi:hypothetical protein